MADWFDASGILVRSGVVVLVAITAHSVVHLIRHFGTSLTRREATASVRKLRTVITLTTSVAVFMVYFAVLGFIFNELGIPLTAYLASASVIGLAVGFGSQGVVQDVVTGLTLIFADLLDVGEMINIGGQVGLVRSIGMRFVTLENSFGAKVSVPNRTIANIVNYPRGFLRCMVDVRLSQDPDQADRMVSAVNALVPTVPEQFPGIMRHPPTVESRLKTSAGGEFIRIKFRIWPDRGDLIEKTFRQELLGQLKRIDPDYADWQVSVYFEVEKRAQLPRRRLIRR
jgi:small-conductance mechanosensitive channel